MHRIARLLLLGVAGLMAVGADAAPLPESQLPAPLKPWVGWALYGHEDLACPDDNGQRLCEWPSSLRLDLADGGGRFAMTAQRFSPGWIALPGGEGAWPLDVGVDGRPAAVLMHEDGPAVFTASGEHRIEGRFDWPSLPESLPTPDGAGLLALSVNGTPRASIRRDADGGIPLGRAVGAAPAVDNHVEVQVYRRVVDGVPLTLVTHLDVDAAGEVREQVLGPLLPAGFVPLSIDGELPARLDGEGRLHLQLRPGHWPIELLARADGTPARIERPAAAAPWPDREVWSFAARRDLRVVDVGGGTAIDPQQTQMPSAWKGDPAFAFAAGEALTLDEKQRGLADLPPDALSLRRELWLDFDGAGYTLQDRISGGVARSWRLDAAAPVVLGQVEVDGQPQLITQGQDGSLRGVEIRKARLAMSADARIEEPLRRLPVSGWNVDFQTASLRLHLPPAWRLVAAPGADNVPDTWVARWTLLDLFVVLIVAVATLRVFGAVASALALFALALTWHEAAAPHWSWVLLIALIALHRALPAGMAGGRLHLWLGRLRWAAAVVVALVAVPFFVEQARLALYLQLEPGFGSGSGSGFAVIASPGALDDVQTEQGAEPVTAATPLPVEMEPPPPAPMKLSPSTPTPSYDRKSRSVEVTGSRISSFASKASVQRLDPGALTQTGPGLPQIAGETIDLSWAGPVTSDQTYRLWLSPPWLTRLLRLVAIALVAALLARWLDLQRWRRRRRRRRDDTPSSPRGHAPTLMLLLALALGGLAAGPCAAPAFAQAPPPASPSGDSGLPSDAALEQLRSRLTAPPDCAPACIAYPRLRIETAGERLTLRLTADAQAAGAAPLPVPLQTAAENGAVWQPETVLVDGHAATLRRADDGALWTHLPAGRHELVISGPLAGLSQVQLPMPLAPQQVKAELGGWRLDGVDERGVPGAALQLVREQRGGEAASGTGAASEQTFAPLLQVVRTVHLGLDWEVDSTVTRSGTTHTALLAAVPLLPGEAVTGDAVRVQNGAAQVSFAPNETTASWSSRLPITPKLELRAPDAGYEIWRFDIGPVWHVDFAGLVPVQQVSGTQWLPSFQPWPGETLRLDIRRPAGASGQTLTLRRTALAVQPGQRVTDLTLDLDLQSSQGGQHRLPLPAGASVQGLTIDHQPQPARLENGTLVLPLHPGTQRMQVTLRVEQGLSMWQTMPELRTGLPGVNALLSIELPADRWVLLAGGPRLGPAVLFWGLLGVLLLVAAVLSRSTLTPLRLRQWLLLSIGLSQIPVVGAGLVVLWLFALGARGRYAARAPASPPSPRWRFNTLQVGLVVLSLVALGLLATAIAAGLLGAPDMQVTGNGSSAGLLRWYTDRYTDALPHAWVLSVSIWWYRLLMLLWALWLANALLGWLRWGWAQFAEGGVWRARVKTPIATAPAPSAPPQ